MSDIIKELTAANTMQAGLSEIKFNALGTNYKHTETLLVDTEGNMLYFKNGKLASIFLINLTVYEFNFYYIS